MTDFERLWVWRDPAIARSLGWYRDVAVNRKPAKFRIARTIPLSLSPEDATEDALWRCAHLLSRFFLEIGLATEERRP